MKKTILLIGILVVAMASTGIVFAKGYHNPGQFHEQMEEIVENGNFSDLQEFRQQNEGFGGPWWVDSQEDFVAWQERHGVMEENRGMPGFRRHSERGFNCPMREK